MSAKELVESLASGTTFKEISGTKFGLIPIPLPPLGEQKRIITKLDALTGRIRSVKDRLEYVPQLIKQFRQSVLIKAVTGELTRDWRNNEHLDWEDSILLDLIRPGTKISYGVIKLGPPDPKGVPCLRTSDLKHLYIDLASVKRINKSISDKYSRTILHGDEVLVSVRGSLGGVSTVPPEAIGFNVSREIAVVPVDEQYYPDWIALWIGSLPSQRWLEKKQKGTAYIGINLADLRQLPIRLPTPSEQKVIVSRVKTLFRMADRIEERLASISSMANQLQPSVLAKAFRGELAPQDPNDEPAGKLLERIRAERKKALKEKPKRVRRAKSSSQKVTIAAMEDSIQLKDSIKVFVSAGDEQDDIVELLKKNNGGPMRAKDVWALGKYKDDIAEFYKALREEVKVGNVREVRKEKVSYLELVRR